MPRDGSGIYSRPPGTNAVPDTTIDSAKYNNNVGDVEQDLNLPRPIIAGGTGASTADNALTSLSAEKANQVITNWDALNWRSGSFYAATSATGTAPVASHAFAGICYFSTASDPVIEATDLTDTINTKYIRVMTSGVWGTWASLGGGVRYDTAQALTAAQQVQARKNIYAAPFDAMAYNGMQINGSHVVSQERGNTSFGATISVWNFVQDGWKFYYTSAPLVMSAFPAAATAGPGFNTCLAIQATTGKAALAATDQILVDQPIEGYRVTRLAWGTANAQPLSIGFWVQTTIAGTMTVVVFNGAANRYYAADVVISAGSTWEYKTLTIPGDTTGTWAKDNTVGAEIRFCFGAGTSQQGPVGSWGSTGVSGSAATTNFFATNNNAVNIANVIVLPGVELPSAARAPLIMRPYDQELITCQRYWFKTLYGTGVAYASTAARIWFLMPAMRATPTLTLSAALQISDTAANYTQSVAVVGSTNFGPGGAQVDFANFTGLTALRLVGVIPNTSGALQMDARL